MRIACPRCPDLDIRDGKCPRCGFALTVGDISRFYWGKLIGCFRRKAVISCPSCGHEVAITASVCPSCNQGVTASAVVNNVTEAPRRQFNGLLNGATPGTKRRVQWAYLLASALGLWCLLSYVVEHNEHWFKNAALSVIYLAVISFIIVLLVPQSVFNALAKRAGWRIKLALIANYLTLLLTMQILIGALWARATMLAGLFVVSYVAVAIFKSVFGANDRSGVFDPSQPQGRRGRFD